MSTYPYPDNFNTASLSDVLVFVNWNLVLSFCLLCSEEILDWAGIPNDHDAYIRKYRVPMKQRSYASKLVHCLTTPVMMSAGMRMLTSVTGLGPIGASIFWTYILGIYYTHYILYETTMRFVIFIYLVFFISLVTWVPNDAMSNLYWGGVTFVSGFIVRWVATLLTTDMASFQWIAPLQHIIWDPLMSYQFCLEYFL